MSRVVVRAPRRSVGGALARAVVALLVAVGAAGGLLFAPGAVPTILAATPDLTLVTDARYDVQPDASRVHVTVNVRATNHRADTVIRRYYFDRAYLAVLPGTTGFAVTASGAKPTVRAQAAKKTYTLLQLSFGKRLYSKQSLDLTLTFDLPDPGGAPSRDVRVGQALVSFPVWAFASDATPGSTVSVVFPSDFHVEFDQGQLDGPTAAPDGSQVFTSGALDAPLAFFAYVVADRPSAYAEVPRETAVDATAVHLTVRSWADDPAWGERVGDLFVRGLPVLGAAIGLPFPGSDALAVQESVSRSLGGYAGLFDPATRRIEVAYNASSFVVLHEAAHAWFNGALLADRWANEAFASLYAEQAAATLAMKATEPSITGDLEAARIPLNAWGVIGTAGGTTEDFAYAATLALARSIAARAGDAGLRTVWAAIAAKESAYQPARAGAGAAPETAGAPPDWRGLLDMLDTLTGATYDDLWREWVVRPAEAGLLDDRAAARADYAATVAAAGEWELPRSIRQAMAAWQFAPARGLLAQARDVLARRTTLDSEAAAAGLTPPPTLEQAFEGGAGLRAALAEADAEIAAVRAIASAAGTAQTNPDPVSQVGLLGADPVRDLTAAKSAFASGDLRAAVSDAEMVRSTWTTASAVGRGRLLSIALLLAALALTLATRVVRRRRGAVHSPAIPDGTERGADGS